MGTEVWWAILIGLGAFFAGAAVMRWMFSISTIVKLLENVLEELQARNKADGISAEYEDPKASAPSGAR